MYYFRPMLPSRAGIWIPKSQKQSKKVGWSCTADLKLSAGEGAAAHRAWGGDGGMAISRL